MVNEFGSMMAFGKEQIRRSILGVGDAIIAWPNDFDQFQYIQLQMCCSHHLQTTSTTIKKETIKPHDFDKS